MANFSIVFSSNDIIKMNKTVKRSIEIENGSNFNSHRIHKNKKAYNRKEKYKENYV